MTRYFDADDSEACVIERMTGELPDRTRTIFTALIRHLHGFVKDVRPTEAEWAQAIGFLTETGKMCDGNRQEWILASDVLGVSMLIDSLNHPCPAGETENTVLGPFHVGDAPLMPMGADLRRDGRGEACLVEGRVLDAAGNPVEGAMLDVWSDAPDGFYDVQKPGEHPPMNLRGRFITGADGDYRFTTALPVSYPIPDDGPVGRMLRAMGRHPWRPAHIHFIVSADGFDTTTTHIFVKGDAYLASDAVFGVKDSLIVDFVADEDGGWRAVYDFILRHPG
jgi:hydroxyquinol 1,2-dioxygenase